MNKGLNQMSSQELEELKIKISKELNNRQLSAKDKELEKFKQEFSGKYFKWVIGIAIYVGYIKSITTRYSECDIAINYAGFTFLNNYGDISLKISSNFCIPCNVDHFTNIQCITKDEMKGIFKEYIENLNEYLENKVFNKIKN